MGFGQETFFDSRHDAIVYQWVEWLKTDVGPKYSTRPAKALRVTATMAYEAAVDVIIHNDNEQTNAFSTAITIMRL